MYKVQFHEYHKSNICTFFYSLEVALHHV